jgi:hypothetical protein
VYSKLKDHHERHFPASKSNSASFAEMRSLILDMQPMSEWNISGNLCGVLWKKVAALPFF